MKLGEKELEQVLARVSAVAPVRRHHSPFTQKGKYNNTPVSTDEGKFASKKEEKRWGELKLLEAAGKISDLKRQVRFELADPVILDGRRRPALRYFADATYTEDGKFVVEDTKGYRDQKYRIKRHLMMSVHGIEIKET